MSEEAGYAEGWKPSPGDEVGGRIIDIAVADNGWGAYPVLTLSDEGGTEVAVHAFHDVLQSELARRRPKVGDEISIKYLGQPNGKRYHAYRVRGGEEGGAFDWTAFGGPQGPPSSDPPIAPSAGFADASSGAGTSAPAPADMGPLPPQPPAPQGEQFGDEPPFAWEGPILSIDEVKTHDAR